MAEGSEQDQNRTEPASPFKLREARKKGQTAKSLEINSLALLGVALLIAYFSGSQMISGQLALSHELFTLAGQIELTAKNTLGLFEYSLISLAKIYWSLILILVLTGLIANMLQTGPILSLFPLKPDLKRINPVTGFKRIFSKKLLFESVKTVLKMGIFGSIIYFAIIACLPYLMPLLDTDPHAYTTVVIDQGRTLAYKLLLALIIIALLDLVYSRWDFAQQMRMSHRDVKEEHKRREGDPQIRNKRRQLQKEALQRAGSLRKVPDADVLITNPTHFAIALKYERGQMSAPQVLAKGAGELALKMREIAKKHRVIIVENKTLARKLFSVSNIDESIPESLFPDVAKILAWVFIQQQQSEQNVNRQGGMI